MKIPLLLALAVFLPLQAEEIQGPPSGNPVVEGRGKSPQVSTTPRKLPIRTSVVSPDSVPRGGIRVLANALGDVVQDSSLNLLDLLRVRDITIGRSPSPTGYERAEADLNRDGSVTVADLEIVRDILLRKIGVPYVIDPTGGSVYGDGITLTFPPGTVDGTVVVSVQRQGESEFAAATGVDTRGAVQDSAYFMTGFEIKSNTLDFKLPVGVSVKLDSMPPCAYQGLNGLFAVVPDRDGDGRTDLFLINELKVNSDSLTLTAGDIPVPSIETLSLSEIEPGQPLYITGHGFGKDPQSVVLHFQSTLSDTSRPVRPSVCDDSTIIVTVPDLPVGGSRVTLENVVTGLTSNAVPLQIKPFSAVVTDIRTTIVGFYMGIAASLDSVSIDTLVSDIEDTTVRGWLSGEMQLQRASIDSDIVFFSLVPDSLLESWRSFAAFLQNLGQAAQMANVYRAAKLSDYDPCDRCNLIRASLEKIEKDIEAGKWLYWHYWASCQTDKLKTPPVCWSCREAEKERLSVLRDTDTYASLSNSYLKCKCLACYGGGKECECYNTMFSGYGPKGMKVSGGYNPGGGFSTSGCCINIIRYKRNPCTNSPQYVLKNPPVPVKKDPLLTCPSALKAEYTVTTTEDDTRPHPGSIIKVTNAPVPYNIVGILNENGHAFIPQVPMNTKVTYSLYDPATGFYDPDVGTYTTGSEPGGFDWPLLLFRPNAQIKTVVLRTGEPVHDSVSVDLQRIDYMLTVGAADTAKLFNVGFSASARLSLKIEDPQGGHLFDDSDVGCYATAHLRFGKVGTYRIRVALGVSIQAGSFDLGVCYSPYRPIAVNCLCGTVVADSLFFELSPYDVKCSATILANDTLRTEAGVTLEFEPGGAVTATGALTGVGTAEKPITLRRAGVPSPGPATAKKSVSAGKEVQP